MTSSGIALELAPGRLSLGEMFRLSSLAEERGLESVWLQEDISRDIVSVLGALSQTTERIGIATGPINVWSRTPYLMAMTAASLAELSGGRFRLGLSPGHQPTVESLHGLSLIPLDDAPKRVREILLVLKALLAGRSVSLDGTYIHVTEAQLSSAPRFEVPVYINARQGEILESVGELIAGAIISIATPQWFSEYAMPRIASGAARAGRDVADVDIAYHPVLCLSDDVERAIEAARRAVSPYFRNAEVQRLLTDYGYGAEMERLAAEREAGAEMTPSDELVRAICLVGDADMVSRRIDEYRAVGVRLMIMRPYPVAGESHADAVRQAIDQLARL